MIKHLQKALSYILSLKNLLKKKDNSKSENLLPDTLGYEENLARNIIGGSSRRSIKKKLYDPDTLHVHPSRFFDNRNPRELSVNRISTISNEHAHQLGIDQKEEINKNNPDQKPQVYHGYAKLSVQDCLDAGCTGVEKEDYGGSKPYHANILYPEKEKFEEMEIANMLAFKANLIKYEE